MVLMPAQPGLLCFLKKKGFVSFYCKWSQFRQVISRASRWHLPTPNSGRDEETRPKYQVPKHECICHSLGKTHSVSLLFQVTRDWYTHPVADIWRSPWNAHPTSQSLNHVTNYLVLTMLSRTLLPSRPCTQTSSDTKSITYSTITL